MELMEQIQLKSVEERIQLIELILQTVKRDVASARSVAQKPRKPFRVRTFSLGEEVSVDRDMIYAERFLPS